MPCTISLQYLIRDDKLYAITTMRSNDAYLGFRNDLYCFTELQKKMAKELNVELGWYQHQVGSLHLYHDKLDKIIEALKDSE
jgi:thymidylate synthase